MTDEYEYFANKKANRTYFSKPFKQIESFDENLEPIEGKPLRIVSKVFDTDECQGFAKIKNETLLRVTPGERQEIKAIFYQDSREIKRIIFQRFTIKNGTPMKGSFSFGIDEIEKIYNLLKLIKFIELDENEKTRFDDNVLNAWFVTDVEKRKFLLENSDLITEIVKNDITKSDVVAFGYRKKQLEIFERLLHDSDFFDSLAKEWNARGKEAVWQKFFESNPWIFGYGLHYIFNTQLDNKKLEQITTGYSVQESGKRVDALMKTSGLISSLCFIEIKTHITTLLSKEPEPYRAECWRISNELAGSVSQVQKTVQKAIKTIETQIKFENKYGEPTGEVAFLYQPKAYVVIGSLSEFVVENGINEQKFSSFELFRRNITNPEIITFDELYDRAKFIAQLSENESTSCKSAVAQINDFPLDDDIPF